MPKDIKKVWHGVLLALAEPLASGSHIPFQRLYGRGSFVLRFGVILDLINLAYPAAEAERSHHVIHDLEVIAAIGHYLSLPSFLDNVFACPHYSKEDVTERLDAIFIDCCTAQWVVEKDSVTEENRLVMPNFHFYCWVICLRYFKAPLPSAKLLSKATQNLFEFADSEDRGWIASHGLDMVFRHIVDAVLAFLRSTPEDFHALFELVDIVAQGLEVDAGRVYLSFLVESWYTLISKYRFIRLVDPGINSQHLSETWYDRIPDESIENPRTKELLRELLQCLGDLRRRYPLADGAILLDDSGRPIQLVRIDADAKKAERVFHCMKYR
jgi:hypothetical protein